MSKNYLTHPMRKRLEEILSSDARHEDHWRAGAALAHLAVLLSGKLCVEQGDRFQEQNSRTASAHYIELIRDLRIVVEPGDLAVDMVPAPGT